MQDHFSEDHRSKGIEATLHVIGGKWKILILWHLMNSPRRYGQLRRLIPEITEKMLIQQLRELETDGVVGRTASQDVPPRVEYDLTPYGETLKPALLLLCQWGDNHLRNT
jgi:DNA-binding HxlR family transcriptional regulator